MRSFFEIWLPVVAVVISVTGSLMRPQSAIAIWTGFGILGFSLVMSRMVRPRVGAESREDSGTIYLGSITISSGEMLIADTASLNDGISIQQIPNGTHRVLGAIVGKGESQVLAKVIIDFKKPVGAFKTSTLMLGIDSSMAVLGDLEIASDQTRSGRAAVVKASKCLSKSDITANRLDALRQEVAYGINHLGIVVPTGVGDGQYEVQVVADSASVCSITCTFLADDEDMVE